MSHVQVPPSAIRTLADLQTRLGGVPLDRIRFHPAPGTATIDDVVAIERLEGKRCELVAGVLVEKPMGFAESQLALFLGGLLNQFVVPRNLGIVSGADGTMELMPNLVRIPDVAFTNWDRMPGRQRPVEPIPNLAPNLAVEILSASNTPGEMAVKRQDYFDAGVQLVWEVDRDARSVTVYTAPDRPIALREGDALDGGSVLPGFTLAVQLLFAEMDRQG